MFFLGLPSWAGVAIAIIIFAWLIVAGLKSATGNISLSSHFHSVTVNCTESPDGRFRVLYANYDDVTKLYGARIVDAKTGEDMSYAVGDTLEDLEAHIRKIYDCDGHLCKIS